ncbi:MAG: permease [Spirochaetales bacterium]|nr:permease [Spirochaetales bacterium]
MTNEKLLIALEEFWHVTWVLVVIILGISLFTGFVKEFIPQKRFQKKLKNQNLFIGAIMGAALGMLTPFCSASMVPIAMGIIQIGAPFSTVLPFLISAPLCNFVVVGIIWATFGWKIAILYLLWTFLGSVVAGLTIGRSRIQFQVKNISESKSSNKPCKMIQVNETKECSNNRATEKSIETEQKIRNAIRFAGALSKQIIPYAVIGAAISGIALAYLPSTIVERYVGNDSWYAIPLASAIGVPLYLRIEMAIPLLKTLLMKGMSMGAAIALLIGGTGASLPELAILSSMLKPKGVITFGLTVVLLAMMGGFLFMFI